MGSRVGGWITVWGDGDRARKREMGRECEERYRYWLAADAERSAAFHEARAANARAEYHERTYGAKPPECRYERVAPPPQVDPAEALAKDMKRKKRMREWWEANKDVRNEKVRAIYHARRHGGEPAGLQEHRSQYVASTRRVEEDDDPLW